MQPDRVAYFSSDVIYCNPHVPFRFEDDFVLSNNYYLVAIRKLLQNPLWLCDDMG